MTTKCNTWSPQDLVLEGEKNAVTLFRPTGKKENMDDAADKSIVSM